MKKISVSYFDTYTNHRNEPYFTFLKNGQKTIEGRIKKELYGLIKTGDHIIVSNKEESDSIEVVVKRLQSYPSVRSMLETEPFKKLIPNAENIEQCIEIYEKFYSPSQEKEFGVVAIEVEKVN